MKIRKVKERMFGVKEERDYDYSGDANSAMATNPDLKKQLKEKTMQLGEGNSLNPHVQVPTYEVAGNEVFLPKKRGPGKYVNAYITFGHDRPNHLFSGYGGQGGTRCSTIDICAGSASSLKAIGAKGENKGYTPRNVVGKIFAADASRIYISQMTDVDANFGLPVTNHGDSKGTPAIAIKSDHIRIIGRSSIKLYAGSGAFQKASLLGEKSGAGGGNHSSKVIELIASDVRGLEPVVKGTRLLHCLSNVYGHIAKLYQRVLDNNTSVLSLRSAIMLHFHPSTPVVTFPDAIGASLHAMAIPGEISTVVDNVTHCLTSELDKAQYLGISPDLIPETAFTGPLPKPGEPAENKISSIKGTEYILSDNVFTT